ncbi:hypothetical protein ABE10_02165, partial [Bacillus toyonensis]|nr:hypothetical protein [Bacillus toyonensis]
PSRSPRRQRVTFSAHLLVPRQIASPGSDAPSEELISPIKRESALRADDGKGNRPEAERLGMFPFTSAESRREKTGGEGCPRSAGPAREGSSSVHLRVHLVSLSGDLSSSSMPTGMLRKASARSQKTDARPDRPDTAKGPGGYSPGPFAVLPIEGAERDRSAPLDQL